MLTKTRVYGTSPTIEGITALISRFYGGSTITLNPVIAETTDDYWTVSNSKGLITGVRVVSVRGRYSFQTEAT